MQRLCVHHCLRTSFRDSHPLEHPVHSALVKKETPGVPNKQTLPGGPGDNQLRQQIPTATLRY